MELTAQSVKQKASLAGSRSDVYWRTAIVPTLASLTPHYRALARKVAYQVSMSIVPYTHADKILANLMEKPMRSTIPWDALVDQYGIDRQYVAITILIAIERFMAKGEANTHTMTAQRNDKMTILNKCLGATVPSISPLYLDELAKSGRFPNTLARFKPEYTMELAARTAAKMEKIAAGKYQATRKYEEGQTWAGWKQARAAHVRTKAAEIVAAIEDHHQASYSVTPPQPQAPILKVLADLAKPAGTTKRPPIAAVLVYYHKHILPELRSRGTDKPITTLIHTQAAALGQRLPQTNRNHPARCIISELTSQTTGTKFEPIWDGDADPQLKPLLAKIAA